MKKFTLSGVMLMVAFIGFSQEKIQFGIHAGLNVSSMTIKSNGISFGLGSQAGITGGVDVSIPIAPDFFIQPELSFSQMGAKLNISGLIVDTISGAVNASDVVNYLSLPVLFKYKVPNTGLGIYIGPQFSYLLSATEKMTVNSGGTTESRSASAKDQYKSSEFSGVFGAEYYLPKGFGISARYQLGFANVAQELEPGQTLKHHGFTFTIGYRF
jgi:hypothetical protein